jgi:hypothetical protein
LTKQYQLNSMLVESAKLRWLQPPRYCVVVAITPYWCVLSGEAPYTILIIFDLTRPGLEPSLSTVRIMNGKQLLFLIRSGGVDIILWLWECIITCRHLKTSCLWKYESFVRIFLFFHFRSVSMFNICVIFIHWTHIFGLWKERLNSNVHQFYQYQHRKLYTVISCVARQ